MPSLYKSYTPYVFSLNGFDSAKTIEKHSDCEYRVILNTFPQVCSNSIQIIPFINNPLYITIHIKTQDKRNGYYIA